MSLYNAVKRKPQSVAVSSPSPVGGLNTRDSIAAMPREDATRLDNWFPNVGEVNLRKGFTEHQSPGGTNVDFLMEYHAGSTRQLIAASNGNLWNATSTPSSLGSGFSDEGS